MDDHLFAGPPPPTARRMVGRRPVVLAGLLGAATLAGCSTRSSEPGSTSTAGPATTAPAAADPAPTSNGPEPEDTDSPSSGPLEGWTLEQKVGQLLMVGADTSGPQMVSIDAVSTHHVGNVFISGQTRAGAEPVRGVITTLTDLVGPDTTHDAPLLVATDQEGGQVQVLNGTGFSSLPSASEQATMSADDLLTKSRAWGQELADAGVTMNLAPVADLVDGPNPSSNGPIGKWEREYGHDAATTLDHATAFARGMEDAAAAALDPATTCARGMEDAGLVATYKHFPGLGRVTDNTDTVAGVTDAVTTRSGDPAVSVFADAITGGARVIMVSSAIYSLIDSSAPAVFSSVVVTDMPRGDLGFKGVVITDDVSTAVQVQDRTPAQRAVQAVRAGCDIVLASADATVVADMARALVTEAQSDPALAERVDESAARVLALKNGS